MTSAHPAAYDGAHRLAQRCVLRDAYDDAAFGSFLDENARLKECSRRGEQRLHSFPTLLSDVFCLLF